MSGHPPRTTWIEISRAALSNNLHQLRARLRGRTQLMAIVKANAYGHGAVPVARILQQTGADAFGVATLSEAIELRQGGITLPILVLGYTPAQLVDEALSNSITLTIFDSTTAIEFNRKAHTSGSRLPVHVKVNTGMNRLGVAPDAAPALVDTLYGLHNLHVQGIFTHFATSDELEKGFAEEQYARFSYVLDVLSSVGLRPPVAHAANSAALLTMPHTHLDMVRSGIALYGLDPDMDECPLPRGFIPAMRWKAIVAQVANLLPGESVSYGREFTATQPTRIAVIPVGYADGFPRRPYNWQSVLVRGLPAPILGRVCMDQTIVDITAVERATGPLVQGEEVVLLGAQGETTLTAEAISVRLGTNNYDVVSRILARVPRMYMDK